MDYFAILIVILLQLINLSRLLLRNKSFLRFEGTIFWISESGSFSVSDILISSLDISLEISFALSSPFMLSSFLLDSFILKFSVILEFSYK